MVAATTRNAPAKNVTHTAVIPHHPPGIRKLRAAFGRRTRIIISAKPLICEVTMSRNTTILVLFLAALLEAGGDAVIRAGLHKTLLWQKASLFALAAVVLFAYGWTVNSPPWDFGKLLGLYVVFFFLTAQAISWLVFKQFPSPAVVVGAVFIVTGGVIIAIAGT